MTDIAESGRKQNQGLAEIGTAVQQLDQITQSNARMVGEAVLRAEALERRAATLSSAVAAFQLQQGTAEEAQALVLRAVALGRQLGAGAGLLRSVTDKAQDFHDRDMYVFVLDRGGPTSPSAATKPRWVRGCKTSSGWTARACWRIYGNRQIADRAGWNMTLPTH